MATPPPKLPGLEGQNFQTLKRSIKWTPLKIVIVVIVSVVPWTALVILASSISKVFAGLLVGVPLVFGALMYLIYILTKD
ncbi:MAG: hypothetical protein ACP5D7_04830 [Limnospira sp.]